MNDNDHDHDQFKTIVDRKRCVFLCDVGLVGYTNALCIDRRGDEKAWLIDEAVPGVPRTPHGDADQPHEQLGPLPAHWRHRLALAPFRCGRPRADGRRCQLVGEPGRACGRHSERTDAT